MERGESFPTEGNVFTALFSIQHNSTTCNKIDHCTIVLPLSSISNKHFLEQMSPPPALAASPCSPPPPDPVSPWPRTVDHTSQRKYKPTLQ